MLSTGANSKRPNFVLSYSNPATVNEPQSSSYVLALIDLWSGLFPCDQMGVLWPCLPPNQGTHMEYTLLWYVPRNMEVGLSLKLIRYSALLWKLFVSCAGAEVLVLWHYIVLNSVFFKFNCNCSLSPWARSLNYPLLKGNPCKLLIRFSVD